MGQTERHDKRDCECLKYSPHLKVWDIRLNGINYLCRKCNRYVDPKKWKGGVVHFSSRSRTVTGNYCPCCGQRMSKHRYAKKKLLDSVTNQVNHPELYSPKTRKTLKKKVYLIDNDILIPRVK